MIKYLSSDSLSTVLKGSKNNQRVFRAVKNAEIGGLKSVMSEF